MKCLIQKCRESEIFSWAITGLGIGIMLLIAVI